MDTILSATSYGAFGVVVPALFLLSFLVFTWGLFMFFVTGTHDDDTKEKGKAMMLYGLIVFLVMVGVWTLFQMVASAVS